MCRDINGKTCEATFSGPGQAGVPAAPPASDPPAGPMRKSTGPGRNAAAHAGHPYGSWQGVYSVLLSSECGLHKRRWWSTRTTLGKRWSMGIKRLVTYSNMPGVEPGFRC